MKEEFVDYLNSIGVSKTAQKKVADVHKFYEMVTSEEITAIFVTDYVNEEGQREYENLWFFTNSLVMEAKQFLTADEYDMVPLKGNIGRWEIKKQSYDFEQATSASRLSLEFTLGEGLTLAGATLRGSEVNCDYLRDIFIAYVIPNLQKRRYAESRAITELKEN